MSWESYQHQPIDWAFGQQTAEAARNVVMQAAIRRHQEQEETAAMPTPLPPPVVDHRQLRLQELSEDIADLSSQLAALNKEQKTWAGLHMVVIYGGHGMEHAFKCSSLGERVKLDQQLKDFNSKRNTLQNKMNSALKESAQLKNLKGE